MNAARATLACALALWASAHLIAADADAPIQLPAMIVSDSNWTKPWRYTTGAGMEVLSHCDDDTTRALVERTDRLNQLLGYIVPPQLQFHTDAPRLTILVDAAMAPSLSQNLVSRFGPTRAAARPALARGGPDPADTLQSRVVMLPNLQLEDVDLMAVFAIIDGRNFDSDRITYAPDHVLRLLERRTPPLPHWFIVGFLTLFHGLSFSSDGIHLLPLTWRSFEEQQALKNDADAPRPLMAMSDFFAYEGYDGGPRQRLWQAQAALLIRWALDPSETDRRAAMARFVSMTSEQGASDALLRECFQLGYSDLRDRLSDYLPVAIREPLDLAPPKLTRAPKVKIRDATAAEIGRMQGEWERLEVDFVQQRHPEYLPQYVELARQTLRTGLQRAPDDAGVLTARGLLESDLHDPKAARPFLEAAAMAGAVRPRVYLELAKFRLEDALADPDHDPLSVGQAQVVLEQLQRAVAEQPPLADVYALSAEVWARGRAVLSDAQWTFLAGGMRRFPYNPRLLANSAILKTNSGDFDTALAWAEKGRALSNSTADSAAVFTTLRDAIIHAKERRQPVRPEYGGQTDQGGAAR